jgi:hypothetical protein
MRRVDGGKQRDMELLGLWAVAGTLLLSAVVFGWVTISARPMATDLERRGRQGRHEDLVRRACADLDDEYRQLLRR